MLAAGCPAHPESIRGPSVAAVAPRAPPWRAVSHPRVLYQAVAHPRGKPYRASSCSFFQEVTPLHQKTSNCPQIQIIIIFKAVTRSEQKRRLILLQVSRSSYDKNPGQAVNLSDVDQDSPNFPSSLATHHSSSMSMIPQKDIEQAKDKEDGLI